MSAFVSSASAAADSHQPVVMNAFIMKLVSSLSAIVPFWASNILRFLQMGNEYNMIISLILSHSLELASASFDERTWLSCIGVMMLCSFLSQFGIMGWFFALFQLKSVPKVESPVVYQLLLYESKEEHHGYSEPVLRYCEEIKALTVFVMKHHPGPHVLANRKNYLLPVNQLVIHEDKETGLVIFLTIKRSNIALLAQAPIPTNKDADGNCIFYGHDLFQFINRGTNRGNGGGGGGGGAGDIVPLSSVALLNNPAVNATGTGAAVSSSTNTTMSAIIGNSNNTNNTNNNHSMMNNTAVDSSPTTDLKSQVYVQYILSATTATKSSLGEFFPNSKPKPDNEKETRKLLLSNLEIKKELEQFMEKVVESYRTDQEYQKLFETTRAGIQVPVDVQHVVLSCSKSLDGVIINAITQKIIANNPYLAVDCTVNMPGDGEGNGSNFKGEGKIPINDEDLYHRFPIKGGSGGSSGGGFLFKGSSDGSTMKENDLFFRMVTESKIKFSLRLEEGLDTEFILDDDVRVHLVKNDFTVNFHLIGRRPDVNCRKWIIQTLLNFSQENQNIFQYSYVMTGFLALFFTDGEGLTAYRFPPIMWAICWFVASERQLQNEAKMIAVPPENKRRQSKYSYDLVIPEGVFIEILPDLYLVSSTSASKPNALKNTYTSSSDEQQIIKYSLFSNTVNLNEFTTKIVADYEVKVKSQLVEVVKQRRNLYFLRYKGLRNSLLDFSYYCINATPDVDGNYPNGRKTKLGVSFDNIFHEHVDRIKRDLMRLNDKEYFYKRGIQPKVIYLFSGIPGSGKTVTMRCIAEFLGRSIVSVDGPILSSIHEITDIIQNENLYGLGVNQSNCVFVFDEVDVRMEGVLTSSSSAKKSSADTSTTSTSTTSTSTTIHVKGLDDNSNARFDPDDITTVNKARVNVCSFLSAFDGLELYDGLVVILGTNHPKRLPPALMRDMRCTHIRFDRLRRIDVVNTIFVHFEKTKDYNPALEQNIEERLWVGSKITSICLIYSEIMCVNDFLSQIIPLEQLKIKEEDERNEGNGEEAERFH